MAIGGNDNVGQTLELATPKILYSLDNVTFTELGTSTTRTVNHDERVVHYRLKTSVLAQAQTLINDSTYSNALTDTTFVVDNASIFEVGDVISYSTEKMLVTGVNTGTNVLTVTRAYASTSAVALADNGVVTVSTPVSPKPVYLKFTSTDAAVDLHYTFNGRTPVSKSPKFVDTLAGRPKLYQNSTGDNTVIKVRAFKQGNTNRTSKVVRAEMNIQGGNTYGSR